MTKGRKFPFRVSRANAPFVTVRITNRDKKVSFSLSSVANTNRDKRWAFGINLRALNHFPPNRALLPRRARPHRLLSSPSCAAPLRRPAPPRHARSTISRHRRAWPRRRLPSPCISVPDVGALRDAAALPDTPPRRPSSPQRRPRAGPPLLGADHAPALLLGCGLLQPVCRAATATDTSIDDPLCGRRPTCMCLRADRGTGGFALLTSAREMLASASIYN
jgi:hypothetical protein